MPINCKHIIASASEYNKCGLGLYGGRPSHGTCRRCMERGENTADHAAKLPQLTRQLASAAGRFLRQGAPLTPAADLAAREAICRACPEWDAAALNATGRCRKCGCSTWAKLRMATERCPLGKWEALTTEHTESTEILKNNLPIPSSVSSVSSVVNPPAEALGSQI